MGCGSILDAFPFICRCMEDVCIVYLKGGGERSVERKRNLTHIHTHTHPERNRNQTPKEERQTFTDNLQNSDLLANHP